MRNKKNEKEAMEMQIIATYCLLDDYILSIKHKDWPNAKLTTSEIMLISVVAMRFFYGNMETARQFLMEHNYLRNYLSKSALNRRIHGIPTTYWEGILEFIQRAKNQGELPLYYIVDAFPVSFCRNIIIRNCRIYQGEEFRGYNFSKREWFYGLKVSVIASPDGCPLRVVLCPGREHDSVPFKVRERKLPKGSEIFGDSAYLDYDYQDMLEKNENIRLIAEPKSNSLRPIDLHDWINLKYIRKFIEGAFGVISRMLPKKIHAVTPEGFEIKVLGFLVAAATNFLPN
ncbi:hypothetical protein PHSC3_001555 [Chlamydiales bacterium STE3]|nr:hypothetical protein PHSC3_001555 [Chlamydiales bacterium STE3]